MGMMNTSAIKTSKTKATGLSATAAKRFAKRSFSPLIKDPRQILFSFSDAYTDVQKPLSGAAKFALVANAVAKETSVIAVRPVQISFPFIADLDTDLAAFALVAAEQAAFAQTAEDDLLAAVAMDAVVATSLSAIEAANDDADDDDAFELSEAAQALFDRLNDAMIAVDAEGNLLTALALTGDLAMLALERGIDLEKARPAVGSAIGLAKRGGAAEVKRLVAEVATLAALVADDEADTLLARISALLGLSVEAATTVAAMPRKARKAPVRRQKVRAEREDDDVEVLDLREIGIDLAA